MTTRSILALFAMLAATTAPLAQETCPQERAVYTEKSNGYVLSFREPASWEGPANTLAIIELAFPDGETTVWGSMWIPNGTSHNRARFYHGCSLPGMEDDQPGSSEAELAACLVWEGVAFALADDDIDGLPWFDDVSGAAPTILLPNLGPTIRYSGLVLGPGDEPHDVFTFRDCAP